MDRFDGESKCVMRGSCGKKGFFGKPLPCPYDGPPQEVRVAESFEIVLLTLFPLVGQQPVTSTSLWPRIHTGSCLLHVRPTGNSEREF
jgi:hypothetical protein